jgi:hypothetical protein
LRASSSSASLRAFAASAAAPNAHDQLSSSAHACHAVAACTSPAAAHATLSLIDVERSMRGAQQGRRCPRPD